jgi:hypothetical protein
MSSHLDYYQIERFEETPVKGTVHNNLQKSKGEGPMSSALFSILSLSYCYSSYPSLSSMEVQRSLKFR